mmetsp:Transcript_9914/g.14806  ORF Transcript_9914/g.14806 Transcript_9914/m.14806 type:complete len:110 (-) Transcript_9914:152-481(-)
MLAATATSFPCFTVLPFLLAAALPSSMRVSWREQLEIKVARDAMLTRHIGASAAINAGPCVGIVMVLVGKATAAHTGAPQGALCVSFILAKTFCISQNKRCCKWPYAAL